MANHQLFKEDLDDGMSVALQTADLIPTRDQHLEPAASTQRKLNLASSRASLDSALIASSAMKTSKVSLKKEKTD